jgi:hypothetical protein
LKLRPDFVADEGVIDYVVSFGEDNQGNLMIVDYDGEVFQILPRVDLTLTVNRDTGELSWSNPDVAAVSIRSYTLRSSNGAIDPDSFVPVSNNYDGSGSGDIDNDDWQITSMTNSRFAEESQGDGGQFDAMSMFNAGDEGAWIKSIYEDLSIDIVMADGTLAVANVLFTGNGGTPFDRSDLNFNGALDPDDWQIFKNHHNRVSAGLSAAAAYEFGDLDGDGDNDFADFRLFQADYIAMNGAGAFADLVGEVPEPGALTLAIVSLAAMSGWRLRRRGVRGGQESSNR